MPGRAAEIREQQNVLQILSLHPQRHDRNHAALFRLLLQGPPDRLHDVVGRLGFSFMPQADSCGA
jgi:hypothetical protein